MGQIVIIVGNLGKDPSMKYLESGDAVVNFSVATSKKWTSKSGDKMEVTTWWNVSSFGKQAEACNNYLKKGSKVQVVGEMEPDKKTGGPRMYKKSDGEMGTSYELRAKEVEFLSTGERREEPSGGAGESEIPF